MRACPVCESTNHRGTGLGEQERLDAVQCSCSSRESFGEGERARDKARNQSPMLSKIAIRLNDHKFLLEN